MVLLEPEKFLTELEKVLTASKAKKKGSVFVTMKRYNGQTKPIPRTTPPAPASSDHHRCLVRVTYGKRKLSCHVAQKDLNRFQIAFSGLMRTGMSSIGKTTGQSQPPPTTTTESSAAAVPAQPSSGAAGKSASVKVTKSLPAVVAATAPKKGKAV